MGIELAAEGTGLFNSVVRPDGVDYRKLATEVRSDLAQLMHWVGTTDPRTLAAGDERLAFLINAYNLSVIDAVVRISGRSASFRRKGLNGIWSKFHFFFLQRVCVGGRRVSLSRLERKWILKAFEEPRVHFALNCASESCPPLKRGLYSGKNLDQELDLAARNFLSNSSGFRADKEQGIAYLSRIFHWYSKDFGGREGIRRFIADHLQGDDREWFSSTDPELKFMQYSWNLNDAETELR